MSVSGIPLALAGGSLIFAVVVVLFLVALIYGYFTRTGSGIEQRPWDGSEGAPGAKGPEELSGKDEGQSSSLAQHGTGSRESEGRHRAVGDPTITKPDDPALDQFEPNHEQGTNPPGSAPNERS